MKDQKLTAADLALYFGKYAVAVNKTGEVTAGFQIDGNLLNYPENEGIAWKPILRPLSEMTEEEALFLHKEVWGKDYAGLVSCVDWLFQSFQPSEIDRIGCLAGHYPCWRYLLSRGFDLFGWIDAGLAIDKTKVNENAVNP